MKQYTVYNLETGEITKSGICSEYEFDLQANDKEGVIEGNADNKTAFVFNNKIVQYTELQINTKANRPIYNCKWSNVTFEWVDLRTNDDKFYEASFTVKTIRNQLLVESDWTQLPDVTLANKQDWAVYRQALRDIPQQSGYPFNIIWPVKPE